LIPGFDDFFTVEEFQRTQALVITRTFGLVIRGKKTSALIPFADMFNHRHPQKTNWTYYNSKRGFLVQATGDIKKGE
jgi:hypothetical protein